jgi:hypothetical protein
LWRFLGFVFSVKNPLRVALVKVCENCYNVSIKKTAGGNLRMIPKLLER